MALHYEGTLYKRENFSRVLEYGLQILSFLARCLLYCLGWQAPEEKVYVDLSRHQYIVAIFSHTSNWDFIMMCIYFLGYPRIYPQLYTLMKPQPFSHFGRFLRSIGCLPAPRLEEQNGKFVEELITYMQILERGTILISPKGQRKFGSWKPGYFRISKTLGCPCIAVGIDFEARKLVTCEDHWHDTKKLLNMDGLDPSEILAMEKHGIESKLKHDLGQIIPKHPEHSEYPILRSYDPLQIGIFNQACFWSMVCNIPAICILYLCSSNIGFSIINLIWLLISLDYHRSYETRHIELYIINLYLPLFVCFIISGWFDPCSTGLSSFDVCLLLLNVWLLYSFASQATIDEDKYQVDMEDWRNNNDNQTEDDEDEDDNKTEEDEDDNQIEKDGISEVKEKRGQYLGGLVIRRRSIKYYCRMIGTYVTWLCLVLSLYYGGGDNLDCILNS